MYTPDDERLMRHALGLASRGLFTTTPNPRVGCVLVKDGIVVGEGWHRRAGESHAEVLAIADAGPHRALGATAYVTLEPCNHVGRTPPCVDALQQAGIRRLIVAMQDPNPLVSGQGLQRCRELGIDVRCGLLSDDAMDLNPGFFKRMTTGLPWIRVKTAISVDGRTALSNGDSQWITSRLARDDGHAWRARACAVLTGIGTVRHDNPQMNVRAVETTRQPLRVVVDARFEIDLQSAVLAGGHALVVIAVDPRKPVYAEKFLSLKERGVEVIELPPTQEGKVDLALLMQVLGERAMNEVHVEAGAQLTGAMMRQELIDEWLVYMAPTFLGEGLPIAAGIGPWSTPDQAPRWRWKQPTVVGDAIRAQLVKA
jgi:diaminohydroxyphosphoribosylaminopyrimidine deaminase/5-amino-6-(5-phosphoribosylamino)uracil reductase